MNREQSLDRLQACIDMLKNMNTDEFLQFHKERGIDLDAPCQETSAEIEDDLEIIFPEMKENYIIWEYQTSYTNHQIFETQKDAFYSKAKFNKINLLLAA